MPSDILSPTFFSRSAVEVAPDLIGKILCRRIDQKILYGRIVETEAYSQEEEACHAFRGLTKRTEPLFGPPARSYVYKIYGIHHCLNVVTGEIGQGSGVLFRALEPLLANSIGATGPANVCKFLQIHEILNNENLCSRNGQLWIETDETPPPIVCSSPRIGIKKATNLLWRFYSRDSRFVSGGKIFNRKNSASHRGKVGKTH